MNPILDSHLEMLRNAIDVSHKLGTDDYRDLVKEKARTMFQAMSLEIPQMRKVVRVSQYAATMALAVVDSKVLTDSEVFGILEGV